MIQFLNRIVERIYDALVIRFKDTHKYTILVIEVVIFLIAFLYQPESFFHTLIYAHLFVYLFVSFASVFGLALQAMILSLSGFIVHLIMRRLSHKLYYVDYGVVAINLSLNRKTKIENWRFWTSQLFYTWINIFAMSRIIVYSVDIRSLIVIVTTSIVCIPIVRNLIIVDYGQECIEDEIPTSNPRDLRIYKNLTYLAMFLINTLFVMFFMLAVYFFFSSSD